MWSEMNPQCLANPKAGTQECVGWCKALNWGLLTNRWWEL